MTKRKSPPKELVKPNLMETGYFASPIDSEDEGKKVDKVEK